jgi:hypothetical protein
MYMTCWHKLFCILLLSILSVSSNAQETNAQESKPACPEGTSKAAAAGGGCLLGATLGTFVFPGIGTAVGCAAASLGSWAYVVFRIPEGGQPKECSKDTKDAQSELSSSEMITLNSQRGNQ